MESKEKTWLTRLGHLDEFNETMRKFTINETMTFEEKSYILSCALIFLQEYQQDNRFKTLLEFAYYIILKYSVHYNDYKPLYDFSTNFGFYPISKFIKENKLINDDNILNELNNIVIDKLYSHNGYIQTLEQSSAQKNILNSDINEISFVAPTSFGKSSLIVSHLTKNLKKSCKIAIIVPTKSLLMQTYKMIKDSNLGVKIIIHEEMFNNEDEFIGILTQERALRLLERYRICFDILYIDEAHNLFSADSRNILLARLLRRNKNLNSNHKVIYLSPLISDSNNLKFGIEEHIYEQRIDFSIKEPEYYEYRLNNDIYMFNRFIGSFYKLGKERNMFEYMKKCFNYKNFIYLYRPKNIEKFSISLYNNLPDSHENNEIKDMINILNKYVHKDFYINKLLSKGILYLHGRLPDHIKEYLEYKYKTISNLKYLVANNVILEGMNLPIDTLFILNTYNLTEKKLINLIGRVNRLNTVFNDESNTLSKLLPKVHFVNSEQWNKKNSKMESKIKALRVNRFKDIIKNPTLLNFNIDNLHIKKEDREKKLEEYGDIQKYEDKVLSIPKDKLEAAKIKFIEYGLEKVYGNFSDTLIERILYRLTEFKYDDKWNSLSIVGKIYNIFTKDIDCIIDFQISRLNEIKTRNYYRVFLDKIKSSSLNELINSQFAYFKKLIKESDALFYIGSEYGEISKETRYYENPLYNVYVNLSTKQDHELINLAIVKIKMEEDFISFKLHKLINLMLDFGSITKEEYNLTIHGTNDEKLLSLLKMGLSLNIIKKLSEDNQIKNIYLDKFNNIKFNDTFNKYKATVDDFYKFQLDKFI
jgi:hypothetical protein